MTLAGLVFFFVVFFKWTIPLCPNNCSPGLFSPQVLYGLLFPICPVNVPFCDTSLPVKDHYQKVNAVIPVDTTNDTSYSLSYCTTVQSFFHIIAFTWVCMTKHATNDGSATTTVLVVICGLVDWEITGFEAQVFTYLIVVTGVSEIKDTVTYQFDLVRDHKHTVLFFYSNYGLYCMRGE